MTHIYNLYGLYELCEHVSSNFLDQKMIYHRITFVIFMAFINCIDVFLQIPCNRRWFSTEFTFEIFVAVVSCVVVCLQSPYSGKWFTTRFTFEIFLNFGVDVFLHSVCLRNTRQLNKPKISKFLKFFFFWMLLLITYTGCEF